MNYTIQQGLILPVSTKYIKFTKSAIPKVISDELKTEIQFVDGMTSKDYANCMDDIEYAHDIRLYETDWYRLNLATYKVGCVEFTKNINDDYTFSQFIVKDIEDYTVRYNNVQCTILIPESRSIIKTEKDVFDYIRCFSVNPYLHISSIDCARGYQLTSYYLLNLSTKDAVYKSKGNFVFNSADSYNKYRLSTVDIQASFLAQVEQKLKAMGIAMIDVNRDKRTPSKNQCTYRITSIDKQLSPKSAALLFDPSKGVKVYEMTIDFTLSFGDLPAMMKFKQDYNNYKILSNFTQFNTKDKYKEKWLSNVWWDPIDPSFDHNYPSDEDSNYGFPVTVTARIRYFVVEDPDVAAITPIRTIILDMKIMDTKDFVVSHEVLISDTPAGTTVTGITGAKTDDITNNYKLDDTGKIYYNIMAYDHNCTITGQGFYPAGGKCKLTCIPNKGYRFMGWEQLDKENPLEFIVDGCYILKPILRKEEVNEK